MASNDTIEIPSVCLPYVHHKFDANYVEGIFRELFGPDMYGNNCVKKIDLISRTDRKTGEPFHVVFIHFSEHMYYSDYLSYFAAQISSDDEVKVQYNPPWFWKVRKNKAVTRKKVRSGPRIMSRNDEAEIMKAQSEILQERNDASKDASNGDTLNQARRKWTNHLVREQHEEALNEAMMGKRVRWLESRRLLALAQEQEEALNRLKEEAEKDNEWPPPLEWGEDADLAEAC